MRQKFDDPANKLIIERVDSGRRFAAWSPSEPPVANAVRVCEFIFPR
jgi:hypothetical protein